MVLSLATSVLTAVFVAAGSACNANPLSSRPLAVGGDALSEKLKNFKKRYPQAHCEHLPSADTEEKGTKKHWLLGARCSLDRGVTFAGYELIRANNPRYPFGMYVIFRKQKLTDLSYKPAAPSVQEIKRLMERQFAAPSRESKDLNGNMTEAMWTR